MLLFIDEQLPETVAGSLDRCQMPCRTNGDAGCPPRNRGAGDDSVIAWCIQNDAVLVTADRGRGTRDMVDLLAKHHVPVVVVKPQACTSRQLLHSLIVNWDRIGEIRDRAIAKGRHPHMKLHPRVQTLKDMRRDF